MTERETRPSLDEQVTLGGYTTEVQQPQPGTDAEVPNAQVDEVSRDHRWSKKSIVEYP